VNTASIGFAWQRAVFNSGALAQIIHLAFAAFFWG